jgi:hypothetical protein
MTESNKVRFKREQFGPVACCVGILPVRFDGLMKSHDTAVYRTFYEKDESCTPTMIETRALISALESLVNRQPVPQYDVSVLVLSHQPLVSMNCITPKDLTPIALNQLVSRCKRVVFDTVFGSGVWRECRRIAYECFDGKGEFPSVWTRVNAVAVIHSNGMYESYGGAFVDVFATPKKKDLVNHSKLPSASGKKRLTLSKSKTSKTGDSKKHKVVHDDDEKISSFFNQATEPPALAVKPTPSHVLSALAQSKHTHLEVAYTPYVKKRAIDELRSYRLPLASISAGAMLDINTSLTIAILRDKFTFAEADELFKLYMVYWHKSDKYNTDMFPIFKLLTIYDLNCVYYVADFIGTMDMLTVANILRRRSDIEPNEYIDMFRSVINPGSSRTQQQ